MKRRKLIFVFLFLAVCCSECKKYPDDNKLIHLRSVKERLAGGCFRKYKSWYFSEADYINNIKPNVVYLANGNGIIFYKNGISWGGVAPFNFPTVAGWGFNGNWELVDKNEKLKITDDKGMALEYTIMELDNDGLWFQNDSLLFKFR
jgi:hypothetical protein